MIRPKQQLIFVCLIFFSGLSAAIAQTKSPDDAAQGKSEEGLLQDREIRLLELFGSPYERGLAHGKAMKTEIKDILFLFQTGFGKNVRG